MRTIYFVFSIVLFFILSCSQPKGKHLFILSGQSNMARLNPEETFMPVLETEFGKENIIVAKYALRGEPIRRWYKDWKPLVGDKPKAQPDLYDSLMVNVFPAIENEKIESVTFIWMQGERDAKEKHGEVYAKSLLGLYNQLSNDLQIEDINLIVGRLSDFDLQNVKYKHWTKVRQAQVKIAESNPRFAWINTDDLNDGLNGRGKKIENDLHMSVEGYKTLGERFAGKAIQLIKENN